MSVGSTGATPGSTTARRPAVTVLEVIVIVLVAGLALGLGAMFILRLRETGQRVQCENNLKLLAEGVRRYHDKTSADRAFKQLPPSRIDDGYATWAVLLTPYLLGDEAERRKHPLEKWDRELPYLAQSDEVRHATLIPYFCPARSRSETLSSAGDVDRAGTLFAGALGDYASVAGNGAGDNGPLVPATVVERKGDRVTKWVSMTTFDSLKRGESIVLLFGEKHVPAGQFGDAAVGDGSLYNGAHPASFSRVAGIGFPIASSPDDPFHRNFGSAHPNGVCCFIRADASKTWITPDISPQILGQLSTRGD